MDARSPSVEQLDEILQKASNFLRCLTEANLAGGRPLVPLFESMKQLRGVAAFQAFAELEWLLNPRRIPFGQNGRKRASTYGWPEPFGSELVLTLMSLFDGVDEVLTCWGTRDLCGGRGYAIGGRLTPDSGIAPGIANFENPVGFLTVLPGEVVEPLFHTVGTLQATLATAKRDATGQSPDTQREQSSSEGGQQSGTTTTTAGPHGSDADRRTDGPYEENGQFGIRWKGDRVGCDTSEEQAWKILRHMWPPEDEKEAPVAEVKTAIGSTASNKKWGTNNAVIVRKVLLRVRLGFEFSCILKKPSGIEVFQWAQICG